MSSTACKRPVELRMALVTWMFSVFLGETLSVLKSKDDKETLLTEQPSLVFFGFVPNPASFQENYGPSGPTGAHFATEQPSSDESESESSGKKCVASKTAAWVRSLRQTAAVTAFRLHSC